MAKVIIDDSSLYGIADSIRSKKGTETTYKPSEMAQAITDIPSGSSDDSVLVSLIDRSITEIIIPEGVETVGVYMFRGCGSLTSVSIPDSVKTLSTSCFHQCTSLSTVKLPTQLERIESYAFADSRLTTVDLPPTVINIALRAFSITSLTTVNFPSSLLSVSTSVFEGCTSLEYVTLADGFNCSLNLSASTLYSVETIVSWLNALADRTGQTAYTLTIGADNLAKLTEEQIAIATAKNWTLA